MTRNDADDADAAARAVDAQNLVAEIDRTELARS